MYFGAIIVVLSGCCLCSVIAGGFICPFGVTDTTCSPTRPCRPGYSCTFHVCCQNPCPDGYIEGTSCNLLPGQQRCPNEYQCMNNVCCKPNNVCPSGVTGPVCSQINPCKPGYSCIGNVCCRDPVCPDGYIEGPSCNLLPGQQRCPNEYQCINNFCCKPTNVPKVCPEGTIQVPGSCPTATRRFTGYGTSCPRRSKCIDGLCCRNVNNAALCPQFSPPKEPCYRPSSCQNNRDCEVGQLCCKGPCGEKYCYNFQSDQSD